MHKVSPVKYQHLQNLSDKEHRINALAIDQRQSLRKMIGDIDSSVTDWSIIAEYKKAVSSELTKYASSILLDSEYGLPAASVRSEGAGLLISYEVSGYDKDEEGRLPKLLPELSVKRLKEFGVDALNNKKSPVSIVNVNEEELNVPNELIGKLYTKQSKNYFATTKERIADAKQWLKENKMEAVLIEA